jgi:hypothetical protein
MTEKTKRYIAKLKLSGITLDLKYTDTYTGSDGHGSVVELLDIHRDNPDIQVRIDVSNIENGNVILTNSFLVKLSGRMTNKRDRHYIWNQSNIQVNIDNINFDLQDALLSHPLVKPSLPYLTIGKEGLIKNFTLNENSWSNFDKALYHKQIQPYFSTEHMSVYKEVLNNIVDILRFDTYVVNTRIQNEINRAYGIDKMQYYLEYGSEYRYLDHMISRLNFMLSMGDKVSTPLIDWDDESDRESLHKLLYDISELIKDHNNVVDIQKSVEMSLKKVSDELKLNIYYSDVFNTKAPIISERIEKMVDIKNCATNKGVLNQYHY